METGGTIPGTADAAAAPAAADPHPRRPKGIRLYGRLYSSPVPRPPSISPLVASQFSLLVFFRFHRKQN